MNGFNGDWGLTTLIITTYLSFVLVLQRVLTEVQMARGLSRDSQRKYDGAVCVSWRTATMRAGSCLPAEWIVTVLRQGIFKKRCLVNKTLDTPNTQTWTRVILAWSWEIFQQWKLSSTFYRVLAYLSPFSKIRGCLLIKDAILGTCITIWNP